MERFLDREKRLGRSDLILPVYYVNCLILNDEIKREEDPLMKVIAARQYADWRELRFEPFTSPQVGKRLAKMATQIAEALERGQPKREPAAIPTKSREDDSLESAEPMESSSLLGEDSHGRMSKTEPPTIVVDAFHRGDHTTLADALAAAKPGDRILVRPGLYREGVVVDKPVEIIGDGELENIVIEANGKSTIVFRANMGRIANLTLRQTGGGKCYCVDIGQGRLDLEGCDVSSRSLSCIGIRNEADPRLKRNRIHDSKQAGVFVYNNGMGTLEDNDIFANALSGVQIKEDGNPTLRNNRIHDSKQAGVYVYKNGMGTLEDNDIFANAFSGVQIKEGGNPTLRNNRIHDSKQSGVFVYNSGMGTLEDNDIFANAFSGVQIKEGGNPTLRNNRISKNGRVAIWIYNGGQGLFEDNDLRENVEGAWNISPDCQDKVKRRRNQE